MKEFKGAIFDLDGTILDSMWVWKQVDVNFLGKRGIEISADYVKAISALNLKTAAEYTKERFQLPETVEEIGISAFYMCTSISEYTVIDNNKNYTSDARGVLFNKDKTTLIYYPIANTETEYTIPNTVTEISANAFSPCLKLTKVTVPDSVERRGDQAFAQCTNLKDIVYEGTKPENIAENAFDK